jgi:hypothetical protein
MRVQAIRASETLYKAGDKSFATDYRAATKDPEVDVALQAMLTLTILKVSDAASTIQATMSASKSRGVQEIGKFLLTPASSTATAGRTFSTEEQQAIDRGAAIYSQLCFTPRRGRTGHADGRRLGRVAARAVACRFATGPGSP